MNLNSILFGNDKNDVNSSNAKFKNKWHQCICIFEEKYANTHDESWIKMNNKNENPTVIYNVWNDMVNYDILHLI